MSMSERRTYEVLSSEQAGLILAALWEWQRDSDPVAQELHDRLADCAEIVLVEHEDTEDNAHD